MAPMMKRFTGLLNRSKSTSRRNTANDHDFTNAPVDSPEANAPQAVRLFCESGANSSGGEEVLHLPVIVESAESSPGAAAGAALQIRKFLGKEYATRPYVQYNAIMLIRILSDNPGATFTRNFDAKFVAAVKELLRNGRDPSTQQILRETLDTLEVDKSWDEGLGGLLQMWRKEKGNGASMSSSRAARMSQSMGNVGFASPMNMDASQGHGTGRTRLPNPAELASRVEEAKNTAKILLQLVQSTPSEEVLNHDLIKEFSERCSSASRSMQNYINCDNPAPDHDTMQTLIETNEQLSLAMSRHQRAVLAARRAIGAAGPTPDQPPVATESNGYGAFAPPAQPLQPQAQPGSAPQLPPVAGIQNGFKTDPHQFQPNEDYQVPPGPPPNRRDPSPQPENPFADPSPAQDHNQPTHYGAFAQSQHHRPQPSQSFNIEPEPTFTVHRQNTADLENAYSDSDDRPSPVMSRVSMVATSDGVVSPSSPYATHDSGVSYEGGFSAQAGPAGPAPVPMNGANGLGKVPEIDGDSQVGRRERDRV